MEKLLLNFEEAYKVLTGATKLPKETIKSRLGYLRKNGLGAKRIGRNYFYTLEHINNFIAHSDKETNKKKGGKEQSIIKK